MKTQHENIDIVVIVEANSEKYVIIIEDKIDAPLHNDLKEYRRRVESAFGFKKDDEHIIPIVVKTGESAFLETLQKAHKAKYAIVEREDLLKFFKENEHLIQHPFLIDFRDSLQSMQDKVMSYRSLPIEQWTPNVDEDRSKDKSKDKMKRDYSGWYGFCRALYQRQDCPFKEWHEVSRRFNRTFISCEGKSHTDICNIIPACKRIFWHIESESKTLCLRIEMVDAGTKPKLSKEEQAEKKSNNNRCERPLKS